MAWIIGLFFCCGIAMASNDGYWFPWINIVGVFVTLMSIWMGVIYHNRKKEEGNT